MRSEAPPMIKLSDYQAPAFLVRHVDLKFCLHPTATRVFSRLECVPNTGKSAFLLNGEELQLISVEIDGKPLADDALILTETTLEIAADALPDGDFTLCCETEINPEGNTSLDGLYMSKGMYCTQCEAEGFRKITFFPDRPDIMATYSVRIESDEPVMLSNGNPTASGPGWAEWHDPWPKPSYLFALVAGNLVSYDDSFLTMSGREVGLKIYVRPGDKHRCEYAMDALKRSMRWDEQVYGREYDLDLFMIVAVDDFNMGAMENKGLNIFNSKYVLASAEIATDRDYELIEGIIAHEYFHNWTGNRITCRDWFQLCLKEGLTVYRDQQFSGDQRGHAVQRIDDVKMLRARQFREDAGPLAHPVRPEEYIEINNFYTATVYEKGAEVIGMLRTLVGAEAYERALTLYFQRHDGQACTIEDWIKVFEDVTGTDLAQFKRWYSQAGTPRISVKEDWDGNTYMLTLTQKTDPTPGQPDKQPLVIPVASGLLGSDGTELHSTEVLVLDKAEQTYRFEGLPEKPIPSLFRGFSAPVIVERKISNAERAFLLANDTDPFNKWEMGRAYALDLLSVLATDAESTIEPDFLNAMATLLEDQTLDPAFKALALSLPSIEDVMDAVRQGGGTPDPMACYDALSRLDTAMAGRMKGTIEQIYNALDNDGPYTPDPQAAGERSLRGRLLGLISRLEPNVETAMRHLAHADNMTDIMQALPLLIRAGRPEAKEALGSIYESWKHNDLVLDKWFAAQAMATPPEHAAEAVAQLTEHPDFHWKNPNRFRSVIGVFAMANVAGFHRADGAGYKLLTDWLIRLDPVNPQTTARLAGAFETWRNFDDGRQALMLGNMQRIADLKGLSKDTGEIIGRILEAKG
ncbi:aminopeptidase N [Algicella marina]|uniref:Aminopeptidase N n=1 Tax=Algicella marina TaxID=2683284 RepID=A0A6P1SY17_9RHOB|nr:aminopeptidase N [Algicella marina]QHQ34106.1 aminopeptidase N [Algicella marina]